MYVTFRFACCGMNYIVSIQQTVDATVDLATIAHDAEHPECGI